MARPKKEKNEIDGISQEDIAENLFSNLQSQHIQYIQKELKIEHREMAVNATKFAPLNLMVGGGFEEGRILQMVGRPGSGKSSLAVNIIANFQEKYGNRAMIVYIDSEKMNVPRLEQLGLYETIPHKVKYIEDMGEIVYKTFNRIDELDKEYREKKLIKNFKEQIHVFFIVDSISNFETRKMKEAKEPKEVLGLHANMTTFHIKKIAHLLDDYNSFMIVINQIRDNINMTGHAVPTQFKYGGQTINIPGGKALHHNSDYLFILNEKEKLDPDDWYGLNGHVLEIKAIKNKSYAPDIKMQMVYTFLNGVHPEWSLFKYLLDNDKIVGTKAKYKLSGYVDDKGEFITWRKIDFLKKYTTEPEFRAAMQKAFDELTEDFNKKYASSVMCEQYEIIDDDPDDVSSDYENEKSDSEEIETEE